MIKYTKAILIKQLERDGHIRVLLGWTGATNSNDEDILSHDDIVALANSLKPDYVPPVLIQHDWDIRSKIGAVIKAEVIDEMLIATLDITDETALDKIYSNDWVNVSIGYAFPSMELLEVSFVAIPAIRGAKVIDKGEVKMKTELSEMEQAEMVETTMVELDTEPTEDIAAKEATEEAPAVILASLHESEIKTYAVKIEALEGKIRDLEAKNQELVSAFNEAKKIEEILNQELMKRERMQVVKSWLDTGKSTIAQYNLEQELCLNMNNKDWTTYQAIKGDSKGVNPFAGQVTKINVENNDPNDWVAKYRSWRSNK